MLHETKIGQSYRKSTFWMPFALLGILMHGPTIKAQAQTEETTPPEVAQAKPSEVIERVMNPWKGDFDGMVKRRLVRVLVAYGRTAYFIDRGQQRGITYELFKELETNINQHHCDFAI